MRERDGRGPRRRAERVVQGIAVSVGVVFVAVGAWAFFDPEGFFAGAARFDPYNAHFLRDIGAFQIGLGAVLLLAAFATDALVAALAGVGIGAAFHVLSHVVDRHAGGDPRTDIPLFTVIALVLFAGAVVRARDLPRRGTRG